MENISTSEMLGHLRTANRLFKSFEKAIEIAEVLAEHEGAVSKLQSEISKLEAERDDSDKQCEVLVGDIGALQSDYSSLKKQMEAEQQHSVAKARTAIDNAKAEADLIVANANTEVKDTLARIAELSAQEAAALSATKNAVLLQAAAEKKVNDFKASFATS